MGLRTFGAQLKALALKELFMPAPVHGMGSYLFGPARTQYNYAADVRDGLTSSVVMPVIQFMARAFPEAPLVVRRRQADELEIVEGHPLVQLVERPNPFYPGSLLWMTTLRDWCWVGESYWRILFDRGGGPGELWWMPPWACEPKWPSDGSVFISHYDYHPDNSTTIRLELEEVLHFRHGMDPWNPRHGLPPLRAILQDIWIDQESNHFVGAMLRNMGVPGMVLSPKGEDTLSQAEVDRVQAYIASRFTGDSRGLPMAMGAPTDVQKLSFSPHELDLSTLRSTAEERVCGALGIPAAVVGFRSGLETTKVGATMREYVRLAWTNGLVPVQRLMAAELQRVLLPAFEENADDLLMGWNYDEVEALQESRDDLAKRYALLVTSGILKVSEARQDLGYDSDDEDDLYLRPNNLTPIDPKDQMPEPEPLQMLPASGSSGSAGNGLGNGNGNGNNARPAVATREWKQGTMADIIQDVIARHAVTMDKPPRKLLRLAAKLWRKEQAMQPKFHAMILAVLKRYGEMVAMASREVVIQKAVPQDIINMGIIHERLPFIQIQAELAQVYEQMYEIMTSLTIEIMKEALNVLPVNTIRIQNQLRMLAQERVGLLDLPSDARESILRSLDEARVQGFTEDQMIDMLRNKVPSGRWTTPEIRAQILARNETRFATNVAASTYATEAGIDRVLILDARLGPTDTECLVPGTMVVAPDALGSFTRYYEGELISISTTDGKQLTMTPNHPVLTPNGWVAAGLLKEGGYVIGCADSNLAMRVACPGCPEDYYKPTMIQEAAKLPQISLPHETIRKTTRATDFHGDGIGSQVHIERFNRELWCHGDISVAQHLEQDQFIGALKSSNLLFADCLGYQPISRLGFPTDSRMSIEGSFFPLLRRFFGCSQSSSCTSIPGRHSCIFEGFQDSPLRAMMDSRNNLSRAARLVGDNDLVDRQGLNARPHRQRFLPQEFINTSFVDLEVSSNPLDALSSHAKFLKLIKVNRSWGRTHVYNLRTGMGWYIANGIITHNCEMRNGWVVSPSEGQKLAGLEHPNGTLAILPLPNQPSADLRGMTSLLFELKDMLKSVERKVIEPAIAIHRYVEFEIKAGLIPEDEAKRREYTLAKKVQTYLDAKNSGNEALAQKIERQIVAMTTQTLSAGE